MGKSGPPGLSSAERADMWYRWKADYRMREIARALRCDHGTIRLWVPKTHAASGK